MVVDHDRRRVVWAGPGREAETLEQFFDRLGLAGCARVELVTADLAASYGRVLRACVPQARVVYDRFHLERLAADAVDAVRRTEQRHSGKMSGKTLKRTRYALLKAPARLKPGEARRLLRLRQQNRALGPRLQVEGALGDDPRAGQAWRGRRAARPVAGLGGAVTFGTVRQARADDPQARCRILA